VQETKAQEHQVAGPDFMPEGYRACFRDATTKKGYSGVAIYARREPDEVAPAWLGAVRRRRALHRGALRQPQRRVVLHPVRVVGRVAPGLQVRVMEWLAPILDHWLNSGRDYVLCGDWNIVRSELDIKNWKSNQKNSGCLPRDATGSTACASTSGWVDAYRALHAQGQDYTWWSNRGAARAKNVGGASTTSSARRRCATSCRPVDPSERRGFRTTRPSSWTMPCDRSQSRGWRTVVRNLRNPKVAVMLMLGLQLGHPAVPGRQHARLLDARERRSSCRRSGSCRGSAGVFAEVPVGAVVDKRRCAGARPLARAAARLDVAGAVRRRRGACRHGDGAAGQGDVDVADRARPVAGVRRLALVVAFASATQDIVIDAWRIESAEATNSRACSPPPRRSAIAARCW
jgi:exodeoxyribonuclease-3